MKPAWELAEIVVIFEIAMILAPMAGAYSAKFLANELRGRLLKRSFFRRERALAALFDL